MATGTSIDIFWPSTMWPSSQWTAGMWPTALSIPLGFPQSQLIFNNVRLVSTSLAENTGLSDEAEYEEVDILESMFRDETDILAAKEITAPFLVSSTLSDISDLLENLSAIRNNLLERNIMDTSNIVINTDLDSDLITSNIEFEDITEETVKEYTVRHEVLFDNIDFGSED